MLVSSIARRLQNYYNRLYKRLRPKKVKNPKLHRPSYEGRHTGRDFLILGMGPSAGKNIQKIKDLIAKDNLLVIGCNNCFDVLHRMDYHVFSSRHRLCKYGGHLKENGPNVLISPYIPKYIIRRHYKGPYEKIMYHKDNDIQFDVIDGIIQSSCKSVALLAAAIAMVMGGRKIYAVGIDGYVTLIKENQKLHYNDSAPKFTPDQSDLYLRHYAISQKYHERFLKEMSDYIGRFSGRSFSIITPTEYTDYYDPDILKNI